MYVIDERERAAVRRSCYVVYSYSSYVILRIFHIIIYVCVHSQSLAAADQSGKNTANCLLLVCGQ